MAGNQAVAALLVQRDLNPTDAGVLAQLETDASSNPGPDPTRCAQARALLGKSPSPKERTRIWNVVRAFERVLLDSEIEALEKVALTDAPTVNATKLAAEQLREYNHSNAQKVRLGQLLSKLNNWKPAPPLPGPSPVTTAPPAATTTPTTTTPGGASSSAVAAVTGPTWDAPHGAGLLAFQSNAGPAVRTLQGKLGTTVSFPTAVENVYRLTLAPAEYAGGFYTNFFDVVEDAFPRIPTSLESNKLWLGLLAQFTKLAKPFSGRGSLGEYKGAASEIVSALLAAASGHRTKLKVPTALKTFDPSFIPAYLKTPYVTDPKDPTLAVIDPKTTLPKPRKPVGTVQDVDRTETIGPIKFYVEVKSDPATAVRKHGTFEATAQLHRYLAVIKTRNADHPLTGMTRACAVEITNPAGWEALFRGTTKLYYEEAVWLFIDGQRFAPAELQNMHAHVVGEIGRIGGWKKLTKFPRPAEFAGGATPSLN